MSKQNHNISSGMVFLVGAGPGDPELITLKGMRMIQSADVIVSDRLVNPLLLEHARADVRHIRAGKNPGKPSVSQLDINRTLIREAEAGNTVVRLKGGDPFIFGRGGEECLELAEAGIPFEVVPGISSVTGATAYAGIPLTMRNLATGFTVISGHLHSDSRNYNWQALASTSTLVILMGMQNLPGIIRNLIAEGKPAGTPVALIRWGTTRQQDTITGTLADIPEKASGMEPPVTIVIGDVVRHHETLKWFEPEHSQAALALV